jgi:aryl sulfotransferase
MAKHQEDTVTSDQLPKLVHTYQNHILDSTRWERYAPREGDVIVATSYKSGTTWMQNIVLHLFFLGQPVPPVFEASLWIGGRWNPIEDIIQTLEAQQHRRCIKTHLALDGLPFYPQVRYIVVGRYAPDVCISLHNHFSHHTEYYLTRLNSIPGRVGDPLPRCEQDIHAFWRDWITRGWFEWECEGYPYYGNLHHTRTWWAYRDLDNILFVHFNDLIADLHGEIARVAAFLDVEVTDEAVAAIAQAVSFDTMKQSALQAGAFSGKVIKGGAQTFFFRGTNGRWKGILSDDELAMYDETAAKVLTPDCAHWLERGQAALRSGAVDIK